MSIANDNDDWEDVCFKTAFDATCINIEKRQQYDASFQVDDLGRQLENLYIWDGWANGSGDRGRVGDIDMQATIAAIQYKLYEWKQKLAATRNTKEL
jgi:S-formylglutathione hydrolase FrmB